MPAPRPVDEHGHRVQGMFDDIAHGYDRANRWMSMGTDIRWRRQAVAGMLATPPPTAPQLLDLCAGAMDSSVEIHRQHPNASIIAGDFAQEMLTKGAHKLVGSAKEKITPRAMDAHELPLDSVTLDAIFCAFGIRNLSDLPRATREQARCLKPGGMLNILEFFRPTAPLPRTLHALYNRTLLPLVGWAATGNISAYTYLPRSIGQFESVEDYTSLLTRQGLFDEVEVHSLTLGMAWIVRARRTAKAVV